MHQTVTGSSSQPSGGAIKKAIRLNPAKSPMNGHPSR